jgi:tetratricopeptide (TPR) repeat protein
MFISARSRSSAAAKTQIGAIIYCSFSILAVLTWGDIYAIAATPTIATPVAQTPMTPEKLLRQANRKLAESDYKGAIADFDQAIKLKPDSALYYRYRGAVRSALGDKPGTIADYQKAADLYQTENDQKNRQDMLDQIKQLRP